MHPVRNDCNSFCALGVVARLLSFPHPVHMPRKATGNPTHYIRAWRKHRGYSLERLAEMVGMSHQNLGKIERGKVPFNETLLDLLADALQTDRASLLMRDPSDPEGIWSIWDALAPTERRQVVEIAKTLKRTGTDG